MSDKRKIKQKRKRGYLDPSIDFVTELTPNQCIERLKSISSPLDDYPEIKISKHKGVWTVSFRHKSESAPIWFSGSLTPENDGTHVRGHIQHSYYSLVDEIGLAGLFALWGLSALVVVGLSAIHLISIFATILYFFVTLVILVPTFMLWPVSPKVSRQIHDDVPQVSQWLHTELER
jgi:hypothetical protein